MKTLLEMHRNISIKLHDKMKKFCFPLMSCFGVSQFCHYRISNKGHFVRLGLNLEWEEYWWSENAHLKNPLYCHPNFYDRNWIITKELFNHRRFAKLACLDRTKYKVNFCLQIVNKVPSGIEVFGFSLNSIDPKQHSTLLNELPLIRLFIKRFKEEFRSKSSLLEDNQVDMSSLIGPAFYTTPEPVIPKPILRQDFLKQMGVEIPLTLTPREKEVVELLIKGLSASQIGDLLFISKRTVEHHLERIKDKFFCSSKSELITKVLDLSELLSLNW